MRNRFTSLIALLIVMLSSGAASAQKSKNNPDKNVPTILDSLLYGHENGFVTNKSIIGATIGVYWKGKTYYRSYGLADGERQVKADTNTMFEIGSNTKVFTGLMLSTEIAEDKMSGDEFIDKYVAVNKGIQNKVRLTDIANHISGLPRFHDSASLAELIAKDTTKDPLQLLTDEYTLSVLKRVDTLHNYGKYEYSNLGVGLLGYILQKKENASYEELLQRMICHPLHLKNTTALSDTNSEMLAKGYHKGARAPFINLCATMQGAGSIKSNVVDMMSFVKYHMNGGADAQQVLSIDHKKYYNGEDLQIAMGWHIGKKYGAEIYEMSGDTYGASSLMMFDKKDDLGVVILLNSANSGVVGRAKNAILAKLLDTSNSQNRFALPEIAVDKKILETYVGTYALEHDLDATILAEDGKLAIQLTGQPKVVFKAVQNNWFVMEKYQCQLEFLKNDKGNCEEFNLYQNGHMVNCKRK